MNTVNIIGNLTQDPEVISVGDKTKVNFSIAWNDPFVKDKDRSASFFNCEIWGKSAEYFAKWMKRGDRVGLTGKIVQDRWEKDGERRSMVKIKVEDFDSLRSKPESGGKSRSSDRQDDSHINESDIPF